MKYLLLLFAMTPLGKTMVAQKCYAGIQTYGLANKIGNPDAKAQFLVGYATGLALDYQAESRFTVSAQLLYESRGYRIHVLAATENRDTIYHTHINYSMRYITVPIQAGISIGKKRMGFFRVGVCPGIFVGGRETFFIYNGQDKSWTPSVAPLADDAMPKLDIAGLVEAGSAVRLGDRWQLVISGRYLQSLISMSELSNYKLMNAGLGLGLRLKI